MSETKKLELDSDGTVINNEVHDSTIVELHVVKEGKASAVSIRCQTESNTFFILKFSKSIFFEVNFYGPQNVIREISVINKQDASSFLNEIGHADPYIPFKYSELNQAIQNGTLTFVEINPSVGAQIKLICENVEMVNA